MTKRPKENYKLEKIRKSINKNIKKISIEKPFDEKNFFDYFNTEQGKNLIKFSFPVGILIFFSFFNNIKEFFFPPNINTKLEKENYKFLSKGMEWKVFKKDNTIIKIPTNNLPEFNSSERLNQLKKNYKFIKKIFPKKFILNTHFNRNNHINTLVQDYVDSPFDDDFIINQDVIKNSNPKLRDNIIEFLHYYIKFLEKRESLKNKNELEVNFDIHIFKVVLGVKDRAQMLIEFPFLPENYHISNIIIDKNFCPKIIDFGSPEKIQKIKIADNYFTTSNFINAAVLVDLIKNYK